MILTSGNEQSRRRPYTSTKKGDQTSILNCCNTFSRMLRRKVPVLSFKVGVQGSRRRPKLVAFVTASVRKHPRVSRVFGSRKSCRNAELSSLFTFSPPKVSTVTGIGSVVVAKRRNVVASGLALGLRVSKVSTVTAIKGVLVAKRKTVVTFGLALGLRVSKVSTVSGIGGAVVANRRVVVTFGLTLGFRVSTESTVTGI